jgi:hypothetical protein
MCAWCVEKVFAQKRQAGECQWVRRNVRKAFAQKSSLCEKASLRTRRADKTWSTACVLGHRQWDPSYWRNSFEDSSKSDLGCWNSRTYEHPNTVVPSSTTTWLNVHINRTTLTKTLPLAKARRSFRAWVAPLAWHVTRVKELLLHMAICNGFERARRTEGEAFFPQHGPPHTHFCIQIARPSSDDCVWFCNFELLSWISGFPRGPGITVSFLETTSMYV